MYIQAVPSQKAIRASGTRVPKLLASLWVLGTKSESSPRVLLTTEPSISPALSI